MWPTVSGFIPSESWWTEAHAAWVEAAALIAIFLLDFWLARLALQERREARHERRQAEIARQRSEVTCGGVISVARRMSEEDMCTVLWAGHYKHAGFAFEKGLYHQLPEYLQRKCEPFIEDINAPIQPSHNEVARVLLFFRFPYPNYEAVLKDVSHFNFGKVTLVWDENGKPIPVRRD